jgi:glyoxylase-like metal-dependent hydrolase (beta-lactamase superfamily II)
VPEQAAFWREIADRVFVHRYPDLDLNVGVVLGDGGCLVVDTRSTDAEGAELAAAVRTLTAAPWTVVDTHAHYDHCFGNAAFRPAPIWGHARCAANLVEYGETQRTVVAAGYRRAGMAELAEQVEAATIDPPDRTFTDTAAPDIGRAVTLRHLGRGHTDNDIVIEVPDSGVVFAGDLIEEGAPPACADAFPLDWPDTLAALEALVTGAVVPGHGEVVDAGFVAAQRAELATVAQLTRAAFAEGRPAADVQLPWDEQYARPAVDRAYRQLRGEAAYPTPAEILRAAGL